MDQKHKRLSIIGFAILFVTLLGGTYSFFNYTRTGSANNLRTGRIYFNTTHGDALNLTNVFPMTSTEAGNATLDTVTVGIMGDTTYADGEEFEITLVDVTNTINGKQVPINYIATYTSATGGSIGTPNSDYWEDREDKDANIYLLNSTGAITEGKQVLTGYIKNGSTGISGTLTIKAYIDADRIAISDTYYENATATPKPTGPNDEYGTTTEWVDGRTVFTTSEWDSIANNPISFKIKAESNEGIWVKDPDAGKIASCPDCVFVYNYSSDLYTTWNTANQTPSVLPDDLSDEMPQNIISNDYREVIDHTGLYYFIGVVLNSNNQIERAYACGLKDNEIPFCIEGTSNNSKYNDNVSLMQSSNLWDNTCNVSTDLIICGYNNQGRIYASSGDGGYVTVNIDGDDYCRVDQNGYLRCMEY